jgi:hypothetical protein
VRLIYRLIPKTHELLESPTFFKSHFSPEWDRKPAFKFNIRLDVLLIYRLIPRTHGLLGCTTTFATIPINRFLGILLAFTTAHNVKVLVSGYQSIDIRCMVSPVKFEDGLSMSILRYEQLFTKKGCQKFTFSKKFNFSKHLKTRHLGKGEV